jgi:hypothetical protein
MLLLRGRARVEDDVDERLNASASPSGTSIDGIPRTRFELNVTHPRAAGKQVRTRLIHRRQSATVRRWANANECVCHAALEHDPPERAALLATVCAGDAELRREVESLLAHEEGASDREMIHE